MIISGHNRRFPPLQVSIALVAVMVGCGDDDISGNQNQNDNTTMITREEALSACLISDACSVKPFGYATYCLEAHWDQQRVTGTLPIWSAMYRCVLAAGSDCDAVLSCFGDGQTPEACGSPADGYCDGDVRVYCDTMDNRLYRENCSLANQQCVLGQTADGTPSPVCGLGPCTDEPARCMGNLLIVCDQQALSPRDCAAEGKICGDDATGSGTKACVGAGDPCDMTTYTTNCEGSVLNDCVQNREHIFDCAILPGDKTCLPNRHVCGPAGTQCDTGQESCQGGIIRICVDGWIKEIDCTSLGFRSCELITGGAHCRP